MTTGSASSPPSSSSSSPPPNYTNHEDNSGNPISNRKGKSSNSINLVPVSSIMVKNVKTAIENQSILDACRIMHNNDIGNVVVIEPTDGKQNEDSGSSSCSSTSSSSPSSATTAIEKDLQHSFEKSTGIITERDIVRHIAIKMIGIQAPISDVMTRPVVTVRPETSLAEAIQIMQSRNFRRLVVVEKNRGLIGIITDKDIFRAVARNPASISEFLSTQQHLSPSLPSTDRNFLDQLRIESLGE